MNPCRYFNEKTDQVIRKFMIMVGCDGLLGRI